MLDVAVDIGIPILTGIGGTVFGYEYQRYRSRQVAKEQSVEDWVNDCVSILARGSQIIKIVRLRPDCDFENHLAKLSGFSEELSVLAKNPPNMVSNDAVSRIETMSVAYAKVASIGAVENEKDGAELLSDLFAMAQKEEYQDSDIGGILQNASLFSPGLADFIKKAEMSGLDIDELGSYIGEMLETWESEEFGMVFTEMSSGPKDVDESVLFMLELLLEFTKMLSDETCEALEELA